MNDAAISIALRLVDQATAPMQQAMKMVEQSTMAAERHMASLATVGEGLTGTFNKIAMAATAMASGFGLKHLVDEAVGWNDAARRMAMTMGGTTEQASVLSVALHGLGIENEAGQQAALRLAASLKTGTDKFDQFGIKVTDVAGHLLPMPEILANTNQRLLEAAGGAEKNVIAMTLYGRTWGSLQDILRLTPTVMEDAAATAKRLHLLVGPEGVAKTLEYKTSLNEMHLAWESFGIQIGKELIPELTKLASWFTDTAANGMPRFISALHEMDAGVQDVKYVMGGIKGLYDVLPAEVVGAAGVGLIGSMLFGGKVGVLLGTLAVIVNFTRQTSDIIDQIKQGNLSVKEWAATSNKTGLLDLAAYRAHIADLQAKMALPPTLGVIPEDPAITAAKVRDADAAYTKELEAKDQVRKSTEAAQKATESYIASITKQSETIGQTKGETLAYEAEQIYFLGQMSDSQRKDIAARIDWLDSIERTTEAGKAAASAHQYLTDAMKTGSLGLYDYQQAEAAVTAAQAQGVESINKVTEAVKAQIAAYADVVKRGDAYKEAMAGINLDLMSAGDRQVAEIQAKFDAVRTKVGSNYGQLSVEQVESDLAKIDKAQDLAIKHLNENTKYVDQAFEQMAKSIHTSFVTMFEHILDGGKDTFRQLGDDILGIFKKMLAQMAALAIAEPIIVPMMTGVGSMMGMDTSGMLAKMGMSGASSATMPSLALPGLAMSGMGGTSLALSGIGLAQEGWAAWTGAASPLVASINGLQISLVNLLGESGQGLGNIIGEMGSTAFGAWTAGIGTTVINLLSGKKFVQSVSEGLGAGGGFLAGMSLTYGNIYGGIVGGVLGSLGVGSLFGGDKENLYHLQELILGYTNNQFSASNGFTPSTVQMDPNYNETAQWYAPIANAYSASIGAVQKSFDDLVFKFTNDLPKAMQSQILNTLSTTDFSAVLSNASAGAFGVNNVAGDLTNVATKYAQALATTLGNAYATALSNYINAQGPAGLIGDTSVWKVLTDRVQTNITSMFNQAATAIQGGDITGGMTAIANANTAINQIGAAMTPIADIIATDGLTNYQKQLYTINQQFDTYGKQLEAAGVDLAKYTDLEKAHQIALNQATKAEAATETSAALSQLNSQIGSMQSLYKAVTAAQNSMAGSGTASSALDMQHQLQQAVTKAKGGDFSAALAMQGDLSSLVKKENYGSFADYQRAYYATSAALDTLKHLTAGQVSTYQQMIDLLKNQTGTGAQQLVVLQQIRDRMTGMGMVPGFASGTDYFPGGARVVGERGPEVEVTGPSRILTAKQLIAGSNNNAEVIAELKTLRAELAATRYDLAKHTQKTAKILTEWRDIGMPPVQEASG